MQAESANGRQDASADSTPTTLLALRRNWIVEGMEILEGPESTNLPIVRTTHRTSITIGDEERDEE